MKLSSSSLTCYKSCKRMWELRYIHGLRPVEVPKPLEDGQSYHSKIEDVYARGYFDLDFTITSAMVFAYEKYIYPKIKVIKQEEWFELPLTEEDTLVGRIDAIDENGTPVEHKSFGGNVTAEEYIYKVNQFNDQIMVYMLSSGKNKVIYTCCKKPTIRLKKNETEEEFFDRCCKWYDEDTENKVFTFVIEKSQEELNEFKKGLLATLEEMKRKDQYYYRNYTHCEKWGRFCEYAQVCTHYDPEKAYVSFFKT